MKKWMIGSLILIALMVVAAGVYAQTTDNEKKHKKSECTFVDKNKDSKCDVCGSTADACKKEALLPLKAQTVLSVHQLQDAAIRRVKWFRPRKVLRLLLPAAQAEVTSC